ncbi:MAG: hypothetical protein Q8R57_14580, partial [Bacteroidota bacterium]|nr:hypothetical protein [Bacteroidota bacterium]
EIKKMSNTEHRMLNFEGTKASCQKPEAFVNRSFSVGYQKQKISKEQKASCQRPDAKKINFEKVCLWSKYVKFEL